MECSKDLAGLILMGGKGRRMKGAAKYSLDYQGMPFWLKSCQCFSMLEHIYLSTAKKQFLSEVEIPFQAAEKITILEDDYADIGPLGGIATALANCTEAALFVLPCDVPQMPSKLVELMVNRWQVSRKNVVLYANGFPEPLIAIYNKSCLPVIKQQIKEKNYKVFSFIKEMDYDILCLEELGYLVESIQNINTPEDYQKLLMKGNEK